MTSGDRSILDRSGSTGRQYRHTANLCRCGSGPALPPPGSSPPPGSFPPVTFAPGTAVGGSFGGHSSFRGVQSLPSTPNACRRPLSPPSRPYGLDFAPPTIGGRPSVGFTDILPPPPLPELPPPVSVGPGGLGPVRSSIDHYLFTNPGSEGPGAMSESAVLAGDLSGDDGLGGRIRALQQFNHQQTRSLRYRSSSQPYMKLTTFAIVILALIIIGFIVLSPLFHYLM